VEQFLEELPQRVTVSIQGRAVAVRAWKYHVRGINDFELPVFLLDTDLPENSDWDRTITHYLYGGDQFYRLCQEAILGIGGVRMLRALGYNKLQRFHMNEGHAALLALELLDERARTAGRAAFDHQDIEAIREQCVFTTHTPVAAGHDQFPIELVEQVLGREEFSANQEVFCCEGRLNMTFLALNLSHYVNGVAKRHGEVSQIMFAGYKIDAITNGVHAATWTSEPFQSLYDKYIPGWRQDNFSLRYAHNIPFADLWDAHVRAKQRLIEHVNGAASPALHPDVFTIGFARRVTPYKRGNLLVHNVARLKQIAANAGGLQVIYGGKAHPNDNAGKEILQRIVQSRPALAPEVNLVFLEDYDVRVAKLLIAGVDLWLNTPQPPLEASGTSGMKAALNGVPSLSVLDGWWLEGCIEGQTGWAIGDHENRNDPDFDRTDADAESLYDKLERLILPAYCKNRDRFIDVMRHAISLNGSFFNTQRMVQQYVVKAYLE
jgi:starch phosphorylase